MFLFICLLIFFFILLINVLIYIPSYLFIEFLTYIFIYVSVVRSTAEATHFSPLQIVQSIEPPVQWVLGLISPESKRGLFENIVYSSN